MRKSCFINLLLLSLFVTGCDKDSENGPRPREPHFDFKNECQSFGPSLSGTGFDYEVEGLQYDQPRFNPNNSAELVYREYEPRGNSRLVIYNIDTREKRTLIELEPVAALEVDWGRTGWIAFSDYGQMRLIKENGDSLHTIPLEPSCAEPDFNPDGTVVGFPYGGNNGVALYGLYLLYNVRTKTVDTLDSYSDILNNARPLDWSSTGYMSRSYKENPTTASVGVGRVDMSSLNVELIFLYADMKYDKNDGSGDICWGAKGDKLYLTGGAIRCFPVDSYKEIRIKKGCESRYYEDISISPDNKSIVVERVNVDRDGAFSNTLIEKHSLYIMDVDGCNERLLLE